MIILFVLFAAMTLIGILMLIAGAQISAARSKEVGATDNRQITRKVEL